MKVTNFGGNLLFAPRHVYAPATEAEVLAILDRHSQGKIRVFGALHSWSPAVVCADAVIDLKYFKSVTVERGPDGAVWATAGGGCRIKRLLRKLHHLANVTMPSVGLITEQTVAGAIATGTHGSGKHSLSHYMAELRVAAYDPATAKACIYAWKNGPELRAARCALGCMGITLAVRFRCQPRYDVVETMVPCATLEKVLARESEFPLQQFYLLPHRWSYAVQRRQSRPPSRRMAWSLRTQFYRLYWFLGMDIGLHLVIIFLAVVVKNSALVRFFYRHVLMRVTLNNQTFVDSADRMLVMKHELFQHLEIEIFVPARHVRQAAELVRAVVEVFDGQSATVPSTVTAALEGIGMKEELLKKRGLFTHHYPIAIRRILPDDTLISMASGTAEPFYSISFITYGRERASFCDLASFLARSMTKLFEARLHWGKYFPLGSAEIKITFPHLAEFRQICSRVDPRGVFRNDFVERVLFGAKAKSM